MIYGLTMMWGRAYRGFSETFITPNFGSDVATRDSIQQLLLLRAATLDASIYLSGIRLTILPADPNQLPGPRMSRFIRPPGGYFNGVMGGISLPSNGTYVNTLPQGQEAFALADLLLQVQFGQNQWTRKYMTPVPQALIGREPETYRAGKAPQWEAARDAYCAYLTNQGYQVRGLNFTANPPFAIAGLQVQAAAPGLLGVRITTNAAPSISAGDTVLLQKFRPAKGTRNPTINGTWSVDSLDTSNAAQYTVVYLRNSAGIDPNSIRFTKRTTLRLRAYGYFPITQIVFDQVVTHKRGKPGGGTRGRRLSRPSLDP
jgi:hypothetical protein